MEIARLSTERREQVLRFLLMRMSMDVRGELMAELPVAYVTLYPGTETAVLERVASAIAGKQSD